MWVKVNEAPDCHNEFLWLVVPDHPEELPVVWLVKGTTPDQIHSITIPIRRRDIPAVVEALARCGGEG